MRLRSPLVPVVAATIALLPMLSAPLLIDERILFAQIGRAMSASPTAWLHAPLGGSGTWRPLTVLAFALDGGGSPAISHGLNIALYALLVAGVARWLQGRASGPGAALATAWFAFHPAHLAIAGWVAGRADLLMVLAATGALLALDRGRWGWAALAGAAAVLAKETAVALPLVALALGPPPRIATGRTWRPGPLAGAVGATFLATLLIARPDPSYLPRLDNLPWLMRLWPLYALELPVPWFRPLGVGLVARDTAFALLALPVAVAGLSRVLGAPTRTVALRSLAAAALALLPVAHVLPNDGGQWYLALPSLALAPAVAAALQVPSRGARTTAGALIAIGFVLFAVESFAWRRAAVEVQRRVDAAARVVEQRGFPALPQPPRESPEAWPHVGPSICCGLPAEVFEESAAGGPSPGGFSGSRDRR